MRFRKLRIAWSVVWGIACLLLIVLWVRSYRTFDRLSGEITGSTSAILISYAGHLTAVVPETRMPTDPWPQRDSGPILPNLWTHADLYRRSVNWDDTDVIWQNRGVLGFGWMYRAEYCNMPNGETGWHPNGLSARSYEDNVSGIMMPHWFVVLVFAGFAYLPWLRSRYSLRTLLIATTVIAVVLGLAVWAARK